MDRIDNQFCCLDMEAAIQDSSNSPLTYIPYLRSYIISAPNYLEQKKLISPEFMTDAWWKKPGL